MPSRSPERRTLLASVDAWWKASKALPGFTGDLEAWACATLGIKLGRGPTLGELAGPNGDVWADWLSARIELVRAKKLGAAERSPEWWAARLLAAVLTDAPDVAKAIDSEMRVQMERDRLGPDAAAGRARVASLRKGGRKTAMARAAKHEEWKAQALALDKRMPGSRKERAAVIADRLGRSFRTVYDVLPGRRTRQ